VQGLVPKVIARCNGRVTISDCCPLQGRDVEDVTWSTQPTPARRLTVAEIPLTRSTGQSAARDRAVARVMEILHGDHDDRPEDLLESHDDRGLLLGAAVELRRFLREDSASGRPNIHLLQERAVLVLAWILRRLRQAGALPPPQQLSEILADISSSEATREQMLEALAGGDLGGRSDEDELAIVSPFLLAANEREVADFRSSAIGLLSGVPRRPGSALRIKDADRAYRVVSPMRVGISSANASDNWTFSKLRGGMVLNFAVDLAPTDRDEPRPPISVVVETLPGPGLVLETRSILQTDRPMRLVLDETNASDFFAVPPGQSATPEACFRDVRDPLLLLKSALVFTGIVGFRDEPHRYLAAPLRVLADVVRFTEGRGLRLTVTSFGPSRAGFASSSCVSVSLLRALYGASGQEELAEPRTLSSLALLLENEVGLKSGKQDTDGPIYPGVKAIRYPPTTGFLESELSLLEVDETALREHLVLVNSGVQRPAATGLKRGLNMRHYSYVSRDPRRFGAVVSSLEIHHRIVDAVAREDWPRLGALFTDYMDLRQTIDPGATQSVFDASARRPVLRYPFDRLLRAGLIHGGMYAGAMGGGCMMLVPTDRGRTAGASGRTRLIEELEGFRGFETGGKRPFAELRVYDYAINTRGLEYEESRS
jgi:galactokinase/mevalonate kinase-like predicted kinase